MSETDRNARPVAAVGLALVALGTGIGLATALVEGETVLAVALGFGLVGWCVLLLDAVRGARRRA